MLFILFIIFIAASIFILHYFTNKISNQRKQILLLKYQNNSLSHKPIKPRIITIKYMIPTHNMGLITTSCNLYISPLTDSYVLNSVNQDTSVQIQDSAEINNELWYEVCLSTEETNINSKGWINSQYIKILVNNDY
jgi:hypothetical protein